MSEGEADVGTALSSPQSSPVAARHATRLIIAAWGDAYVERLLTLTLPALLAPGNYPYIAQVFPCQLVIVTERRLFAKLERSATFAQFREFGTTHMIAMDDLLLGPGSYGLTLTMALFRGCEDLGAAMTETNLLFLNADFILADGSYRSLADKLLAGERMIVAPSYCADAEQVLPELGTRRNDGNGAISISNRELARLTLANLHATVRGQGIDSCYHYDQVYVYQFYIQPDRHTLLGYQMPIALVAMRPTAIPSEMQTFWDWGGAAEFCPGVEYCALGDSDDFLMMELREQAEGSALLRLGSQSPARTARLLASVLTSDQRRCAQFLLTLHDRDLADDLADARKQLAQHRDEVLALVQPQPAQHRNNPNWRHHYRLLLASRRKAAERQRSGAPADADRDLSAVIDAYQRVLDLDLEIMHRKFGEEFLCTVREQGAKTSGDAEIRDARRQESLRLLMKRHSERIADFEEWRRLLAETRAAFTDTLAAPEEEKVQSPSIFLDDIDTVISDSSVHPHRLPIPRRLFYLVFGRTPFVRMVHPYWAIFRLPAQALQPHLSPSKRALVVADGSSGLTQLIARECAAATQICSSDARLRRFSSKRPFDFCYWETTASGIAYLPAIFENVADALSAGSRFIVFVNNDVGETLAADSDILRVLSPIRGRIKVICTNDASLTSVLRRLQLGIAALRGSPIAGTVKFLAMATLCLPFAYFANTRLAAQKLVSDRPSAQNCVCMVIEIEVQ